MESDNREKADRQNCFSDQSCCGVAAPSGSKEGKDGSAVTASKLSADKETDSSAATQRSGGDSESRAVGGADQEDSGEDKNDETAEGEDDDEGSSTSDDEDGDSEGETDDEDDEVTGQLVTNSTLFC